MLLRRAFEVTQERATSAENLALTCVLCSSFKGTDLGSLDPDTGQLPPFFNPRLPSWDTHVRVDADGRIQPRTPPGRLTVTILHMNDSERVLERQLLLQTGRYP